nr:uncharacterized protein KIAA0754-like [Aegilops tauschii subsp. strangulata]
MPPTRERRHRRLQPQPEYDFRRQSHLHSPNTGSDQPTHQTTIPAFTANRTSPTSSTCFQPCIRIPHWTEDATSSGAIRLPSEAATKHNAIRLLEDATPAGHSSPTKDATTAARPFLFLQPPPARPPTRSSVELTEPPNRRMQHQASHPARSAPGKPNAGPSRSGSALALHAQELGAPATSVHSAALPWRADPRPVDSPARRRDRDTPDLRAPAQHRPTRNDSSQSEREPPGLQRTRSRCPASSASSLASVAPDLAVHPRRRAHPHAAELILIPRLGFDHVVFNTHAAAVHHHHRPDDHCRVPTSPAPITSAPPAPVTSSPPTTSVFTPEEMTSTLRDLVTTVQGISLYLAGPHTPPPATPPAYSHPATHWPI